MSRHGGSSDHCRVSIVDAAVALPGSITTRRNAPDKPLYLTLHLGEAPVVGEALASELERITGSERGPAPVSITATSWSL